MKTLLIVFLLLQAGQTKAYCALYPSGAQKARVRAIIAQVGKISSGSASLEDFGRATMGQSKAILAMGPPAVYALSNCLGDPDWKVRFWITDMLGYLDNPDAKRPLKRVLDSSSEKVEVKRRAGESLKRLDTPIEHGIN